MRWKSRNMLLMYFNMRWQNKNMFYMFLILELFVIAFPFRPMWIGWILSALGGFLTGYFLRKLLEEKWK